jgi:hypothetical protein
MLLLRVATFGNIGLGCNGYGSLGLNIPYWSVKEG